MELVFLGTGAADWPEKYMKSNDRNHRRYSCMLIDKKLLIDCGPHAFDTALDFGCEPSNITNILITHTHSDHFLKSAVTKFQSSGSRVKQLDLYAHSGALKTIGDLPGTAIYAVFSKRSFHIDGFTVKPLAANHHVTGSTEIPLHYIISSKERTILYASDGAWFLKQTWLELLKVRFDAVIFDSTIGEIEGDRRIFEHNSLPMIRHMLKAMQNSGVVDDCSHIILTHLARTLHASHDETEITLKKEGLITAYDGMRLTV